MKTLLLWLAVGLLSGPCLGQVKVLLMRDTAAYQLHMATLANQYRPLTDLFKAKPQVAYEAAQQHWKQFETFQKNHPNTPAKGFGILVHEFYQPTGQAQWVLVETAQPHPDSVLATMLTVLEAFYGSTPYPVSGAVPFRTMAGMTFGKALVAPRSVRRGAGIISTLEAAERTTRPDTVRMLAFNQLDLNTIPDVVYRFPALQELDLSKNNLKKLPTRLTADIPTLRRLSLLYNSIHTDSVFMARNKHLVALNLQGNKLTRIPKSIRRNRRLESLWLGNNQLTSLDTKTLGRLHRLTDLNLYNAGLRQLPGSIGRLKHVRVLDVYYNKFTELPRQLGRMKRLEQLAIANNDLKELPASLDKLRRLQVLYAHHNRISQLPVTFRKLTDLRILDLGYNWITVVPEVLLALPALEELDLSNNNLQELPTELGTFKQLRKLYLRSNPVSRENTLTGPYAPIIRQLEANRTEVFY